MNLEELLQKYDDIIYSDIKNYSQFTIDFIENHLQDFESSECSDEDYIGGLIYQVENVIKIIKTSKDKDLFIELKVELEKHAR